MKQLREAQQQRSSAILTPEQRAQWDAMKAEREAKRGERGSAAASIAADRSIAVDRGRRTRLPFLFSTRAVRDTQCSSLKTRKQSTLGSRLEEAS